MTGACINRCNILGITFVIIATVISTRYEKRVTRASINHEVPAEGTVVAYGNATINSSMKNFAFLPQKVSEVDNRLFVWIDTYHCAYLVPTARDCKKISGHTHR